MTAPTPNPAPMSPAERTQQVRLAFDAGLCTRIEAVDAIRSVLDVTETGAGELLDNPVLPLVRFGPRPDGGESGSTDGDPA